jgi:hypothetical protein
MRGLVPSWARWGRRHTCAANGSSGAAPPLGGGTPAVCGDAPRPAGQTWLPHRCTLKQLQYQRSYSGWGALAGDLARA